MTTKLTKKLNHTLETKKLITQSLQAKGASINENTPLSDYPTLIDQMKTSSPKKDILTHTSFKEGQKIMVQKHQHNIPVLNGGFTGALVGAFNSHSTTFAIVQNNNIIFGFTSNNYHVYRYDPKTKTVHPTKTYSTSFQARYATACPFNNKIGTNYSFDFENGNTFTELSYPQNGKFTGFNADYAWDSSGTYLIQYQNASGNFDILKRVKNSETNVESYELFTSGNIPHKYNHYTFSLASGDKYTYKTFAINGKTILNIDETQNTVNSFNIDDFNMPVQNSNIMLYGKNYLVLSTGSYTGAIKFYFVKAIPIDEELAQTEKGFYQNPSNYTYTLLHEEAAPNYPFGNLKYQINNLYSPGYGHLDCYLYVAKEKIDNISDFHYKLGASDGVVRNAVYLDENTCLTHSTKAADSTNTIETMCRLYHRNSTTDEFQEIVPSAFEMPCIMLNEHGFGNFAYNNGVHYRKMISNQHSKDFITYTQGTKMDVFMKNGLFCGSTTSNALTGTCLGKQFNISFIADSMSAVVNEHFICNLCQRSITYVSDDASTISLSNSNLSYSQRSRILVDFENNLYLFDFNSQTGQNIQGTCQLVTPDIPNQTFNLGEAEEMTGSFSKNYFNLAKRIKHKNLFITSSALYGYYKNKETNRFHFQEIAYPDELTAALNGETPFSIQTYYDSSVGFQLQNGITLIAFIEWDETSTKAHLKQGTTIQIISPAIQVEGVFYTYLSPFKVFQYIHNPTYNISHCTYSGLKEEEYTHHIEENTQSNWNETSIIAVVCEKAKEQQNGYLSQKIQLEFD